MSKFDPKENLKRKEDAYKLAKEAFDIVPKNKSARRLLDQAEDDLKVARQLAKEFGVED